MQYHTSAFSRVSVFVEQRGKRVVRVHVQHRIDKNLDRLPFEYPHHPRASDTRRAYRRSGLHICHRALDRQPTSGTGSGVVRIFTPWRRDCRLRLNATVDGRVPSSCSRSNA